MPATNLIVQEFADLLSVVACAATDNHVNEAEAARIRKRWKTQDRYRNVRALLRKR